MHKEVFRPKKVYAMLASRACRSSIMVGRGLDQKTMRKVVQNLSELESPWNCPHGRPTLRFLKKLSNCDITEMTISNRGRKVTNLMKI